ncbi:hypothetical protein [Rhizobium wenxiniae]|uniref:hypothetical protein n=1 Tax=Rhizobium wenxiniae TaxID=1737357 RepID=UPI001C6DFF36|nr:hypothetical protein [Rhizobium wenxiniae]
MKLIKSGSETCAGHFFLIAERKLRPPIMTVTTGDYVMMIIHDWIDDRLEERRFAALPAGNEHDFAMLAGVLRAEAEAAGYSADRLVEACDGDVVAYLMSRQVQSVSAEGASVDLTP